MTEMQINSALQQLEKDLADLKSLLAWEELKQTEARPGEPPGFTIGDTVGEDIKNSYSSFLAHHLELKHTFCNLNNNTISLHKKQTFQRKLAELEKQFRQINLTTRFIKF